MVNIKILGTGISQFLLGIIAIFSKLSFLIWGFIVVFSFFFLSPVIFSSQYYQIQSAIIILTLIALTFIIIGSIRNPTLLRKELIEMKGWKGIASFLVAFYVLGNIFISFQGRIDLTFINGLLKDELFFAMYMFSVAFLEESAFRYGLMNLLFSLTKNRFSVYFVVGLIFGFFHLASYTGDMVQITIAIFTGTFIAWLVDLDEIAGLPTFPMAVAFHYVYNLSIVGALDIFRIFLIG